MPAPSGWPHRQIFPPDIPCGTYSVDGLDQLTYREIIALIETQLNRSARIISLPASPLRWLGRFIPKIAELRRVGIRRDPIHPALPGYHAEFTVADMVTTLTRMGVVPS